MRLIYPLIILFLLTGAAAAQLTPDKDRFDIVLHPGDGEERTLKVINAGDSTIFKIAKRDGIATWKAADRMAEERITTIGKVKLPYMGSARPMFKGRSRG